MKVNKRLPSLAAIKRAVAQNPARSRYKEDPLFRVKQIARTRISCAIKNKGYSKHGKTIEILGCSFEELKRHLERRFTKGMTWANYGKHGWHVDHIVPISAASTPEELEPLLHYMNLQPLWAKENISKSDDMPRVFQLHLCLPS